jgi:N-acetylmuramoyl-L-alanine amidase
MFANYLKQIKNIIGNVMPNYCMILVVLLIFNFVNTLGANKPSSGLTTVIIDAGHGGKDPGAVVGKAREKDIVLDIALRLGKLIRQGLPDVRVIYTRKADFFVPLFERSVIANNSNANLFISIHANYCRTLSVKGTETYVLGLHRTQDNLDVAKKENSVILLEEDYSTRYEGFDPNSQESYIMFELIQDNYLEQSLMFARMVQDIFRQQAQRADRDVRQAGFLVLRETAMPSVLIETGYLSNKSEAAYLMTEKGRETIASSIFKSLLIYKSRVESRLNPVSSESNNKTKEIVENEDNKESIPEKIQEMKDVTLDEKEPVVQKIEKGIKSNKEHTSEGGIHDFKFAIQIAASKIKLPLNSRLFKGITNIREIQVGDFYKYICLESDSLLRTKQSLQSIHEKIPDAFIVGIKNGQPVPFR